MCEFDFIIRVQLNLGVVLKNQSIMFWVVLTLIGVGSLPFLLSWYQINQSREAVVDQAQKNHLIISRATADRFESYIDKYQGLALNMAKSPAVYLQPDSSEASDSLKSGLLLHDEIQLVVLVLNSDETKGKQSTQVIQYASKNNALLGKVEALIKNHSQNFDFVETTQGYDLIVKVPSARPNVDVLMQIKADLTGLLSPEILGRAASISLVNPAGQMIKNAGDDFIPVPREWLTLMANGAANGGANRSQAGDEDRFIAAFAKVNKYPLYVVSRQSIRFAEQSTAAMSRTAWKIFALVLLMTLVLLAGAYFSWVKPIRRIVKAQNALMGDQQQNSDWHGGEVQALEQSFDALTKHINDRNALGQVFVDRYQVISPIGKGGMGSVFLGWDPKLDRHVALKTMPIGNDFESRENMTQTLVQEAITAARISHRNVVSIYDVVSTKTTAFIAMEYIKGESLSSLLQRKKSLNLSLTLSIAIAVLRGLQTAHDMGFVHRDIKPANILLDVNGDIKLTDFGTTALVSGIGTDDITGTHGYMAPEVYQKGEASVKSDLFAVGVVIAECLLGENPFKGKKANQTKFNTLNKNVVFPPWIRPPGSEELFLAIDLLLEKTPQKRPETAAIMAELIVQNTPVPIKWIPDEAGVKIQKNENSHENQETNIAHS